MWKSLKKSHYKSNKMQSIRNLKKHKIGIQSAIGTAIIGKISLIEH